MTDDFGSFTDDFGFQDWWNWVQRLIYVLSQAARRLSLAVISAGGAIAASNMFGKEGGADYARMTLGASAIFAAWFVVDTIASAARGR